MSDDFATPPEELKRVADEISRLREQIQSASAVLGRIEKRLKLAFPNYPQNKRTQSKPATGERVVSNKSRDEILKLFENVLEATKVHGDAGYAAGIEKITDEDVRALAFEVGVSESKRISTKKAREGIRKRIQESLLLSSHRPPGI